MSQQEEMAHSERVGSGGWKWAERNTRDETGRRRKRGGGRGRKSEKHKARWNPKEESKKAWCCRSSGNMKKEG